MSNRLLKKSMFLGFIGLVGGLAGFLNVSWTMQPQFPVYGIVANAVMALVLIAAILLWNKHYGKQDRGDELLETKRKLAAQVGLILGISIHVTAQVLMLFVPDILHTLAANSSGEDLYFRGFGVALWPFIIGMLIGHIVAWLKYN